MFDFNWFGIVVVIIGGDCFFLVIGYGMGG